MFRSHSMIFSSNQLSTQLSTIQMDNPYQPHSSAYFLHDPVASTSSSIPSPPAKKGDFCVGCGSDTAIRVHYGAPSCHGCKAFFRRSVFEGRRYVCSMGNDCSITNESRNRCRACRFRHCLDGGMNPKHVREERNKIERVPPNQMSDNHDSEHEQSEPRVEESQLTQFVCGLERQTELLTDENSQSNEWSSHVELSKGLQNPRTVIKRSPMNYRFERIMSSTDLYEAWYRAFVLHADWAMGLPDFRIMPITDQTVLFKHNFMAFGWITYAYNCYIQGKEDVGIPIGNGSYIPYADEVLDTMDPRWAKSYGIVSKKLINLIVKPMKELEMTYEEYCILKTISLFQPDCDISEVSYNTCMRMRDRLMEALSSHINIHFPNMTCTQKSSRVGKICMILPSFYHIGQIEANAIQHLSTADLTELGGVPIEILTQHRSNTL